MISSKQAIDALANANEITSESLFMAFARGGLARSCEPSIEFTLDELRIFEQPHDFGPHDLVQQILTHRAIIANRTRKSPQSCPGTAPAVRPPLSRSAFCARVERII